MRTNRNDLDLSKISSEVIKSIGVKAGQTVLDFGCGSGIYTIPVAGVVGNGGNVYAVDKDNEALETLMRRAGSAGLTNIERIDSNGGTQIKLENESVDIVLLFDVFHCYYFSSISERRQLLFEMSRILKPDGILSVYPKHMETEARAEIEEARFSLENQLTMNIVHDRTDIQKGHILNFRKQLAIDDRVKCER